MMNPENPLLKGMTPEQIRNFLFTDIRYKNRDWVAEIEDEIKFNKRSKKPLYVRSYGIELGGISEGIAKDISKIMTDFEKSTIPDPDSLLSEEIPEWLIFNHPDNKPLREFLRKFTRREVLDHLGFPHSSGRNGPIDPVLWEERKCQVEESGKSVSYFIVKAPKDPKVFLVRTLWPPRWEGKNYFFKENLLVAKNKKSAIVAHEQTIEWEA